MNKTVSKINVGFTCSCGNLISISISIKDNLPVPNTVICEACKTEISTVAVRELAGNIYDIRRIAMAGKAE
jgi:hypothetical protein